MEGLESVYENTTLNVFDSARAFGVRWDKKGERSRGVLVLVDLHDGQVSLPYERDHKEAFKILNMLVDEELAEWRAIGPEDSEVYALDKLLQVC